MHVIALCNNKGGQNILIYIKDLIFKNDFAISESLADKFCGTEHCIRHHTLWYTFREQACTMANMTVQVIKGNVAF
jgi:hypothetical protein